MKSKKAITLLVLTTLLMALIPAMPANAVPAGIYSWKQAVGKGTVTITDADSRSDSHSALLTLPATIVNEDEARVVFDYYDTLGSLMEVSFWCKPASIDLTGAPDVSFSIDTDDNGIPDAWAIYRNDPTLIADEWQQITFDETGYIGVAGSQDGAAPWIIEDDTLFSDVKTMGDWSTFEVMQIKVGLGTWTWDFERSSYVDDILINTASYGLEPEVTVELDEAWYQVDDTVTVTVTDWIANGDPNNAETPTVAVTSTSGGTIPTFELTETGENTGIFTGTFTVGDELTAEDDDIITVTYTQLVHYIATAVVSDEPSFTIGYVEDDTVTYDQTIEIAGTGVAGGESYSLYWDYALESNLLNSTEVGNPDGTWDCTIDVPSDLNGDHYLWAVSGTKIASYGPITMEALLKLSPSSGLEGDEITIKGYGFGDEVDVTTVEYSSNKLDISPSTPETDELGYWTAKFDVPIDSTFTVYVEDYDGNNAEKEFIVGSAIKLDVDAGSVGTIVEISGRGFTDNVAINVGDVTITDGTTPIACTIVDLADDEKVDDDGEFIIEVVIPSVDMDTYDTITVTTVSDSANTGFEVTGESKIEVTPGHGTQGSTVLVEGFNFTAGEDVTIAIPVEDDFYGADDFEVDSDGTFEVEFVIPAVSTGPHTLLAFQEDYNIEATTEFRAGIMIVILNPTSGPSGTSVTLTGTGFSEGEAWNATFGGETWQADKDAVLTEISANLYVPSVDAGVYTVSILDIEAEITVEVEFEVTETTWLETEPVVAPANYDITLYGYNFAEDPDEDLTALDIVLYNATEEWSIKVVYDDDGLENTEDVPTKLNLDEDWDDGYFEGHFMIPLADEISVGSYTINVTDVHDMFAQLVFEVVEKTCDIEPRKPEFNIGDTLAFDVESSFPMGGSFIEIFEPSGDLYWSTDPFLDDNPNMWLTVGDIQRVLYADQVAGGNPMLFLEDAPLGTWTWDYVDLTEAEEEDQTIDSGAFSVVAAAADLVGEQVADLANDITELNDLLTDVSDSFAGVQDDMSDLAALSQQAVTAAENAAEAVQAVAATANTASVAAENAAEAANAASDAASSLSTLVYGAIAASLVAALAAIVSLMQISKRIAG